MQNYILSRHSLNARKLLYDKVKINASNFARVIAKSYFACFIAKSYFARIIHQAHAALARFPRYSRISVFR